MVEKSELFSKILRDINKLLVKDEIKGSDLDDFKENLETKEVRNYIENIEALSKPESALRETFFNENSPFIKSLFPDFRVIPEDEKMLKILGVNPNAEKELLKLKFTKKELRDLVYFEIITGLESRSRIKTLKDILDKTSVSIIQPNAWENSINLIKGAENKFKEWAKENKILKELASINLAEIDQKIKDADAEIDANIFKLYELDEDEINLVMDSLNTPQYYQGVDFLFG